MDLKSDGRIGALSDELAIQILHYGSCQEILRFATTCKRYNRIVAQSISLQLHLELEANGLEILPGSQKANASHSVLLDELRRYQDAWLDLNIGEPVEKPTGTKIMEWKLNQGTFMACFCPSTLHPNSVESVSLSDLTRSNSFTMEPAIMEFEVDVEQGLVASVGRQLQNTRGVQVDLRSTVDRMPHPLAQNPTLLFSVDFDIPSGGEPLILKIMGHILAVQIRNLENLRYELLLFDWKTGVLFHRVGSGSGGGVCGFVFIDKDHLGLISASPSFDHGSFQMRTLDLYIYGITPKLGSVPPTEGGLPIGSNYNLQGVAYSQPILVFEFPKVNQYYTISPLLFIRGSPTPGHAIFTKSATFIHSRVPTLAICLDLGLLNFRIFIDVNRLFHHIPGSEKGPSIKIPWSDWGPRATRWFKDKECQAFQWDHMISGSRFLRVTDKIEDKPPYELSVFDFNPRTVMRHAQRKLDNYVLALESQRYDVIKEIILDGERLYDCIYVRGLIRHYRVKDPMEHRPSVEMVDSDMLTIIKRGFTEPVESRLPYRVVSKFQQICCRDWTMDGEHIIGINPCEENPFTYEEVFFGGLGEEPPKIVVFKIRS
ncbi:hypothetical protein FRC11_009509 [Ceratobasidium sp. 423]|nr:hypothetical protein FRC11_009509 [Ceratobasidium sp. 423]